VLKNHGIELAAALLVAANLMMSTPLSIQQGRTAHLDPTRPSVYVSEAATPQGQSERDGRAMKWLRLENNCRWTILLPAVNTWQAGDRLFYRVFRFEDIVTPVPPPVPQWSGPGRPVAEQPVAAVPGFAGRYWSDAPDTVTVAPGDHVDFRVRADEVARGLVIIVPFYYDWEARLSPKPDAEPMHFVMWSAEYARPKVTR
jgi:hypothetical protein